MVSSIHTSIVGLQKSSLNVAKAADNIVKADSATEVTEDIIDIKVNANNFKANALVLETSKELHETLLNAIDIEV